MDKMLKNSILVAAHPDDEALWFSSIMDKVDDLLFCYTDCMSQPQWGIGRRAVLSSLPFKNVSSMDLCESEVFDKANWDNPVIDEFGIEVNDYKNSGKIYRKNYSELKRTLRNRLENYGNVISHNPWGEYGNEEHVQLFNVMFQLQQEMHFDLWFSNYCSDKSLSLALRYITGFTSEYVTMKTNKPLAQHLQGLYQRHQCWTWLDNWEWFNEECFMRNTDITISDESFGHIFPLNMIRLKYNDDTSKSNDLGSVFIWLRRWVGNALKHVSL